MPAAFAGSSFCEFHSQPADCPKEAVASLNRGQNLDFERVLVRVSVALYIPLNGVVATGLKSCRPNSTMPKAESELIFLQVC
jgi:hypothetical protein